MPNITRITQQKDKNRANIYLDGKFAFGITLESLFQHGLKVNQEVTAELIQELKNEDTVAKIYNRALAFVTSRPHSEREIKLWLRKKKADEKLQGETLKRLEKRGLVDDLAFAKWWIEQRTVFRPKPKRVLFLELKQKGVANDTIENAWTGTETETDLNIAKKLAEKRWQRLKVLPKKEARQKLTQYLAGRGFSYEVARQAIDELEEKR